MSSGIGRVVLGDTDGDGKREVIVASQNGTTYDFNAARLVNWSFAGAGGYVVRDVSVADMNGDGSDDVVIVASAVSPYPGNPGTAYVVSVPEPSAAFLVGAIALWIPRRRSVRARHRG